MNPNCACGCGKPVRRLQSTWLKGHNNIRKGGNKQPSTQAVTVRPMMRDIYWAAGFIEGEAWFGNSSQASSSQGIRISQVNPEPVFKMLALFGGTIKRTEPRAANAKTYFTWSAYGARARGILMTMYPLLSKRRQDQAKKALVAWRDGRKNLDAIARHSILHYGPHQ